MDKTVEIGLRSPTTLRDIIRALDQVGGFPVLALPVHHGRVVAQGFGCKTGREFIEALRWAYRHSPECRVRIIAAEVHSAC